MADHGLFLDFHGLFVTFHEIQEYEEFQQLKKKFGYVSKIPTLQVKFLLD